MKLHDTTHWTNTADHRGLLFFAQRFDELTFSYTLDSFRASTTNAPHLVRECIRHLKLNKKLGRSPKAVSHILEETRERFKSNHIAAKCSTLPLERYFNFDLDDVDVAIKKLTMLSREVSPPAYLSSCMSRILEVVPTNRKSDIEIAAQEFCTSLLNIGFSAQHLNNVCHESFFFPSNPVDSYAALHNFLEKLQPNVRKFSVFFDSLSRVREISTPVVNGFGVKEIKSFPKKVETLAKSGGIRLPEIQNRIVAFEDIRALDEYSALKQASSRLNWIHDIYGLFRHRNTFGVGTEATVWNHQLSKIVVLRTDINQMHRISDNKPDQANVKLNEMLTELRLPSGPDKNRFFRIINFHGLSTRSASEENQLLNLWTALETITSSHSSSSSIVDTMTREIVPIICLNYLHRLVRSTTLDLVRWDRRKLTSTFKSCNGLDEPDLIRKVFCLIAAEEYDDQKEALLGSITDFELLRFRLFSMNKFLVSGKKILERLERHEKLVTWQLHRIYRARNQIVHSSSTNSNTDSLIVSAHDYFDQVFEVTAQLCSGASGFHTYEECFEYCGERFVEYKKSLSSIDRIKASDASKVLWAPRRPLALGSLFDGTLHP